MNSKPQPHQLNTADLRRLMARGRLERSATAWTGIHWIAKLLHLSRIRTVQYKDSHPALQH